MVTDTENCKILSVFIPDRIVFLFFLQILLLFSKTTSPVKLPLWCDSAKFALNYPTGHFHGNRLLFFRCSLFLKIFQVGFNFSNLRSRPQPM